MDPASARDLCMTAKSQTNNAPVTVEYCDTSGNGIFWFWQGGSLKIYSDYCLDVTGLSHFMVLEDDHAEQGNKVEQIKTAPNSKSTSVLMETRISNGNSILTTQFNGLVTTNASI
jgi:hypothetical protein